MIPESKRATLKTELAEVINRNGVDADLNDSDVRLAEYCFTMMNLLGMMRGSAVPEPTPEV